MFFQATIIVHLPRALPWHRGLRGPIALLTTCRQVYHEATAFFWAHATFDFDGCEDITMFVTRVQDFGRADTITSIQVSAGKVHFIVVQTWSSISKCMPSLQRVHLKASWRVSRRFIIEQMVEEARKGLEERKVMVTHP
jgi:hypothetical protein